MQNAYPQGDPGRPQPARPARRPLRWVLIGSAVALVAALVVVGVVMLQRDDGPRGPVRGQLTGAFPQRPDVAWAVTAAQLGAEYVVDPARSFMQAGAVTDDTSVVVSTGGEIVILDAATGGQWRPGIRQVRHCSDTLVSGRLACTVVGSGGENSPSVVIVEPAARTAGRPVQLPDGTSPYQVAYNGDAAYVGAVTQLSKVATDGLIWTKRSRAAVTQGDSLGLTATSDLVTGSVNGAATVIRAGTGDRVGEPFQGYSIATRADGAVVAVTAPATDATNGAISVFSANGEVSSVPVNPPSSFHATTPSVVARGLEDVYAVNGEILRGKAAAARPVASAMENFHRLEIVATEVSVVLSSTGLTGVDTERGTSLWSVPGVKGANVLTDGVRVFYLDRDGALVGADLRTGSVAWRIPDPIDSTSYSVPELRAAGNSIIVATNSAVVAYGATGGAAEVLR
ncbi:hypothetical protein [Tsukamurella pseudospumae]|nr:hypothetical protein [Tsukamurella pseudospumae]